MYIWLVSLVVNSYSKRIFTNIKLINVVNSAVVSPAKNMYWVLNE